MALGQLGHRHAIAGHGHVVVVGLRLELVLEQRRAFGVELHVRQQLREAIDAPIVGLHGERARVAVGHRDGGVRIALVGAGHCLLMGDGLAEVRVLNPGADDLASAITHQLHRLAGSIIGDGGQLANGVTAHVLDRARHELFAVVGQRTIEVVPLLDDHVAANDRLLGRHAVCGLGVVHAIEVGVEPQLALDARGLEVAEAAGGALLGDTASQVEAHRGGASVAIGALLDHLVVALLSKARGVAGQHDHTIEGGRGGVLHIRIRRVVDRVEPVFLLLLVGLASDVVPAERIVVVGVGVIVGHGGARRVGVLHLVAHLRRGALGLGGPGLAAHGAAQRGDLLGVGRSLGHSNRHIQGILAGAALDFHGVTRQVLGAVHRHIDHEVVELVVAVAVGVFGVAGALAFGHRQRRALIGALVRLVVNGLLVIEVLYQVPRATGAGALGAVPAGGVGHFHGVAFGHEVPLLKDDLLAHKARLGVGLAHRDRGVGSIVVDAVVVGVAPQVSADGLQRHVHQAAVVVLAAGGLGAVVGKLGCASAHEAVARDDLRGVAREVVGLVLVRVKRVAGIHHVLAMGDHVQLAVVQLLVREIALVVLDVQQDVVLVVVHEVAGGVVQIGVAGVVVGRSLVAIIVLLGLVLVGGHHHAAAELLVGDAGLVAVDDQLELSIRVASRRQIALGVHPAQVGALQVVEGVDAVRIGLHVGVGGQLVGVVALAGALTCRSGFPVLRHTGHERALRGAGIAVLEGSVAVGAIGHGRGPQGIPAPLGGLAAGGGIGHVVVALKRDLHIGGTRLIGHDAVFRILVLDAVVGLVVPQTTGDGAVGRTNLAHVASLEEGAVVGRVHPVVGDSIEGLVLCVLAQVLRHVLVGFDGLHRGALGAVLSHLGQNDLAVEKAVALIVGAELVRDDHAAGHAALMSRANVRIDIDAVARVGHRLAVAGEQPLVIGGACHTVGAGGGIGLRHLNAIGRQVVLVAQTVSGLHHRGHRQLIVEVATEVVGVLHLLVHGLTAGGIVHVALFLVGALPCLVMVYLVGLLQHDVSGQQGDDA